MNTVKEFNLNQLKNLHDNFFKIATDSERRVISSFYNEECYNILKNIPCISNMDDVRISYEDLNKLDTLFDHFCYAMLYTIAFQIGKKVTDIFEAQRNNRTVEDDFFASIENLVEKVKNFEKSVAALGNIALKSYEWSEHKHDTDQGFVDLANEILLKHENISNANGSGSFSINDHFGMDRVHVVAREVSSNKYTHILFIAVTGTMNNGDISDTYHEWFSTNLHLFSNETTNGNIHSGFQKMVNNIFKQLTNHNYFKSYFTANKKLKIYFVGHSMGAAVATLLSFKFSVLNCCKCCVVAAVATPACTNNLDVPNKVIITNFIHDNDIVSNTLFYGHVGDTIKIGNKGIVNPLHAHTGVFKELFKEFDCEKAIKVIEEYESNYDNKRIPVYNKTKGHFNVKATDYDNIDVVIEGTTRIETVNAAAIDTMLPILRIKFKQFMDNNNNNNTDYDEIHNFLDDPHNFNYEEAKTIIHEIFKLTTTPQNA